VSGALYDSGFTARRTWTINLEHPVLSNEGMSLLRLGSTLSSVGRINSAGVCLSRAVKVLASLGNRVVEGECNSGLAELALRLLDFPKSQALARRASILNRDGSFFRGLTQALRLCGETAIELGDRSGADEYLHNALTRARTVNMVEEELPTLVALAELRRRHGDMKSARSFLDDVWESAKRGPYPLFHADALNVLSQIERDESNTVAAVEAATRAFRLAWCDGPPYAYHWGLEKGKKHLKELGAPEPEMPRFDESKFEPMPEVEINPEDEFHVGDET
jgi:hypothetical protein